MKFRNRIAAVAASVAMVAGFAVAAAPSASAAETIRARTGYCYKTDDPDKRLMVTIRFAYNSNGTLVRPYSTTITTQQQIGGAWKTQNWLLGLTPYQSFAMETYYTVNGGARQDDVHLDTYGPFVYYFYNQGYWSAASNQIKVTVVGDDNAVVKIPAGCGYSDSSVPF